MDRLNKRAWIDSRRHWQSTLYVCCIYLESPDKLSLSKIEKKCKTFKKQLPLFLLVIISWKSLSFINLTNNLNRKSYMTVHAKCFNKMVNTRDFLKLNNLYQTILPMNRSKVFKPMFFGQYEYHGIMSVATTRMNLEQKLRCLTYKK